MKKIILKIEGMTCSACSSSLEKYLLKQDGIEDAIVNLVMSTASITYNDSLNINDLNNFVKEAGFKSLGEYNEREEKEESKTKYFIINGILVILILILSFSTMFNLQTITYLNMYKYPIVYSNILLIFSIYFLYFGKNIIINGIKNIKYKSLNMDTLITIGVLSSFIYSLVNMFLIIKKNNIHNLYFDSICVILYLVKLGRYIENKNKDKTKEVIKGLVKITPNKAILIKDNKETEVSIDEVNKDDFLIVKPGMKYAVDGIVVKGESYVDETFISGESLPVKKNINDKVVAGSINIDGTIYYKATNIGRNSTISEIVRLVVEATNTKAPISRLADKVSSIFVPKVIIISILTFIIHLLIGYSLDKSLIYFVTVLVCACPCALGLATPLAIVVSEGLSAEKGILIKKSEILENAYKVDTIVFDKTGTLTYGNLKISSIKNKSEYAEKELLKIISSLESKSNHPISKTFKVEEELYEVSNFKDKPGYGITGIINQNEYYIGNDKILDKLNIKNNLLEQANTLSKEGNSLVYVIENNKLIALIGIKDLVRKEAKEVINKLQKLNKNIIMLTGDNKETATAIAKELGITNIIANVTPKEKVEKIKELQKNNNKVIMIGDGINDAPSLSTANIGVSFKSAIDIAANSSDVILLKDDLNDIINLINISKRTIINIKENLFLAFIYNICMLPVAAGLLEFINIKMNPMLGSLAMTLSSITVVLNALRLRK